MKISFKTFMILLILKNIIIWAEIKKLCIENKYQYGKMVIETFQLRRLVFFISFKLKTFQWTTSECILIVIWRVVIKS